jgi:hypothetical protein
MMSRKLTKEEKAAQLAKPRSEQVLTAFSQWIASLPVGTEFTDDDMCRWIAANDPDEAKAR